MPDATHACRETANCNAVCSRRQKNATEAGAGRFEKPAPGARAAPPEAHESLISRKTVAEVPLTGLSLSNGKLERFHRTLKEDAIRPKTPLTLEDAKRIVGGFIDHYNTVRLHSALGYITPADRLAARHTAIFAARDKKLEAARQNRKTKRQQQTRLVA